MNNEQILEQIRKNKEDSLAYQMAYVINRRESIDEIGGHVAYTLQEVEDNICPSHEYLTSLFEECAAGLGFEYEQR